MSNYPTRIVMEKEVVERIDFDGQTVLEVIKELQSYVEAYGDTVFFDYYYGYDGGNASLCIKEMECDESFDQRVKEYEQERASAKEKALRKATKAKEVADKAAKDKENQERKLLKELKEKYGE